MTKLRLTPIAVLVWLFILACQENELEIVNQDVANAKKWFDNNEQILNQGSNKNRSASTISNFVKSPDWGKSKVHEMRNGKKAVEVILNYDNYILFTEKDKVANTKPNVINSLLLIEVEDDHYALYLVKIYPENSTSVLSDRDFSSLNFSNIPLTFSGSMLLFDWNENFLGGWKILKGCKEFFYSELSVDNSSVGRRYQTSAWNCYIITTYWYSQACIRGGDCAPPVLIDITTTQACEYVLAPGDDSGSGGPGDPTSNTCFVEHPFIVGLLVPCSADPEEIVGIDCASFNFVPINTTWQEAAISNIGFKVKVINPITLTAVTTEFKLSRTVWFGLPFTTYNNTGISPGQAAEIAASAVQYASDLVHLLYIENPYTEISRAESVFLSFLKSKMLMDGGRADYYGSGSSLVIPTSAEYRLFGNGDCN